MIDSSDEKLLDFLQDAYSICNVYVAPIICFIGFILSIVSFVTFWKHKKLRVYFFFMVKTLIEILVFAFGTLTPYLSCIYCPTVVTYHSVLIKYILYIFLKPAFILIISILEIVLTLKRITVINSTKKLLTNKNDIIFVVVIVVISLVIFTPFLYAYTIRAFYNGEIFNLTPTDFGSTTCFAIYSLSVSFISNLFTVLILIPLNVRLAINYRRFIKRKNRVLNLQTNAKNNSGVRFNKMVIITSCLFVLCRLFELSVEIFTLCVYFKLVNWSIYYFLILNIFVLVSTYFIFALNFILYYYYNKIFRDTFKKIFCYKKIEN